jgi:hypothetical protein
VTIDEFFRINGIRSIPFVSEAWFTSFLVRNAAISNRYYLRRISEAIKKDYPEAVLFCIGDTENLITVLREDFRKELDRLMNYYIGTEEYEMAGLCQRTIIGLETENVIQETNVT